MSHQNLATCSQCLNLLHRYPGLHSALETWFLALRVEHPDLHVSCAGRGKFDQELYFHRGASKAHYGQSAHNYNCAIDVFQLKDGIPLWEKAYFKEVIEANLYPELEWYGREGAPFPELPHIEIKHWKDLVAGRAATLVEPLC